MLKVISISGKLDMKKDEKGIAGVVEIVIIAAILGVLSFVGYKVLQRKDDKKSTTTATTTSETTAKGLTWQKGDVAVSGKYADADIVQIDEKTWRLYYAVQPEVQGNNFEIYSSTSTDGKTWTQEAGTRKTILLSGLGILSISNSRLSSHIK